MRHVLGRSHVKYSTTLKNSMSLCEGTKKVSLDMQLPCDLISIWLTPVISSLSETNKHINWANMQSKGVLTLSRPSHSVRLPV